jgi:O-antigen/teichoic acid export membrane protein
MRSSSHNETISRNSFGYIVSAVIGRLFVLGSIPILTRELSSSEFGSYIILYQVVTLLQTVGVTLFSQSLLRFYAEYQGEEQKRFVGAIFVSLAALQTALALLFYVNREPIMRLFYSDLGALIDPYFGYVCLWAIIAPFRSLTLTLIKVQEKPVGILVMNLVYGLFLLVFLFLFVLWKDFGLEGVLWSFILAELAGQLFAGVYSRRGVIYSWNYSLLRRCLRFSLPLLGSSFLFVVFTNLDRMILSRYLSLSDLGIYGVGLMIGNLAALIVSSYVSSYAPRLMKVVRNESDREAVEVLRLASLESVMVIGFAVTTICVLSEVMVIVLGHGDKLSGAGMVLGAIATGHFLRSIYLFAQNSLFYKDKTIQILALNVVLAVVGGLALVLLVQQGGIRWAAFYFPFSYAVLMPVAYWLARRSMGTLFPVREGAWAGVAVAVVILGEVAREVMPLEVGDSAYWLVRLMQLSVIAFVFQEGIRKYVRVLFRVEAD